VRLDALLDTGADETVLPRFIAGRIGVDLDPDTQARFRGVGGHVVTVTYGRVELEGGSGFRALRWPATVAFLDSGGNPILGHVGFLQYFTASFNGRRGHVTLTPNHTFPTR
jgi:predicted aspartyl protease